MRATNTPRLEINLTPLLDLVLQLIMFFMLTVNFVRLEQLSEGVDLPVAQSAMPLRNSDANLIYITVNKNGERLAGGSVFGAGAELRDHLRKRLEEIQRLAETRGLTGRAEVIVVVRADQHASWGEVWDTLEECQRAGCQSWQLRVLTPAG